jgi:hypothetical protein
MRTKAMVLFILSSNSAVNSAVNSAIDSITPRPQTVSSMWPLANQIESTFGALTQTEAQQTRHLMTLK